ncbi:ccch-type zinc finger protein [Stylonychia lemnae]|uniref:Ccch-type zinc finger protein n=1 Tax=Stylonychia lemnae TaxID=5949 RepID=A0A078AE81_STYLE|nr:ccch-type zinc finger protein [Stylonychia lemnae]|eukprot:CDW80500.1 ccch-type zinc finger protein [Stylonychia lemnae]
MQEGHQNPKLSNPFMNLQGYSGYGGYQQQPRSMSFQSYPEIENQQISGRSERFGSHSELLQSNIISQHLPHQYNQFQLPQHQFIDFPQNQYQMGQNMGFLPKNSQSYQNNQHPIKHTSLFASYQQNKIERAPEFMTVTVIPLEAHLNPYDMMVEVNSDIDKNLKQIFANQKYWQPVFANHSPLIPPHFSLKCEGYQFPKNPNALPVEQFCVSHFFGPLVVALQTETAPPVLKNFYPSFLDFLRAINEEEGRNYPPPPIPSILNNPPFLPTTGDDINMPQRFDIQFMTQNLVRVLQESSLETFQKRLELYLKSINPIIFYIYRYKTSFCANKSKDHDWNFCVYAHKPFDFRRPPDKIYYLPEKCKNYNQETGQGCREDCQFSHTTFERLYHPNQYKTNPCQQFGKKRKTCQKGELCAFVHYEYEQRHIPSCDKMILFERLKRLINQGFQQSGLHFIILPNLPEMTEEELRHLQRITEQQATNIPINNLSTNTSSQIVNNQAKFEISSPLMNNFATSNGNLQYQNDFSILELASLSLKSKAFTPSYKKASSCNSQPDDYHGLELINQSPEKISEIDVDKISLELRNIQPEHLMIQPKSPIRHQSSSQTNLNYQYLIEAQELTCKQNDDDQESEMYQVIMKSKDLIKPHEDSQTRTSSRFQQFFDKMATSDDQSRKGTENSNLASYDENAAEEEEHEDNDGADDVFHRDIFQMNIENIGINYLKDQHSDF